MKRLTEWQGIETFFNGHNGAIKTNFHGRSPYILARRKGMNQYIFSWEYQGFREAEEPRDNIYRDLISAHRKYIKPL